MRVLSSVLFFIQISGLIKGELFPQGKQWKYSYYGLVRTGSLLPNEAYSQWDLRGLLTISSYDGFVVAQLNQMNSSLYNGPRENLPENLHPTDIPTNANPLSLPFIINYVETQVESISVSKNDPLWSVNMKRAIASLFQLNFDKLNTPASFLSEKNLYGSCNGIEYSVVNNTEFVYVRKVIDHSRCDSFPAHIWSSAPTFTCQNGHNNDDDSLTASTTREYTLARIQDKFELKHVMSNRRLYVQPFQALGEAQQTYQYQVYQLLGSTTSFEPNLLPGDLIKTSLTYIQNITDLTHGRYPKSKQQGVLSVVNALLDEVVTNLETENLNNNIIQFHRELMFLYYNMFLLNKNSFETLYADIALGTSYQQETKRNIFLELLPQIGSEHSMNFIKDLIVKRELKDLITIKMLSMLPFYLKQYSTKILTDFEVLLTFSDNYEKNIRHTAILTFATLVFQTYQAGKCSLEVFENYALRYFNLFAESTSYEKRMLYLQGLDNLQFGSVDKYLTSIVQNNEQSRHIRFLAAWASMRIAQEKPLQVYEIYWPILTDRSQHLEMRVTALNSLLIAQPTKSRLLTLFWYIQAESDPHLYHFFYTMLISLQKTHYPCYKHLGKLAGHVVRFLRIPSNKQHWMTGNYLMDYSDTDRAFGQIIQLFLIGNPISNSPNVIYFSVNSYANQKNLNQMTVYLKIQGISDQMQEIFNQNIDLKDYDSLIKVLDEFDVKLIVPEVVHVELIIKIHSKSVFCYYIDGKEFQNFGNGFVLKHLRMVLEYHINHQTIVVPYTREYMEPSDLGTLVIRAIVSNSIASTRGNILARTNLQQHTNQFAVDFRYYTYVTSFLEIYNPISDMWHGFEKGKKLQLRLLYNGTLNINFNLSNSNQTLIELTEVQNGNEYVNILIHSQSYTYLVSNGTKEHLQFHCPKCEHIYNISTGSKREKLFLINMPFESFGSQFQVLVFDCDSYHEMKQMFADIFLSHQSNVQVLPILKPLMYAIHISDFISYIPYHATCGISVTIKPLYKEFTELKTSLLLNQHTNISTLNTLERSLKTTSSLTLLHRKLSDNSVLQCWNATLVSFWKHVERNLNFSLIVIHKNYQQIENKLCMTLDIQFPDFEADMFSIKPSNSTRATLNAIWGLNTKQLQLNDYPVEGITSIQINASASVTDEQKQLITRSELWPYQTCRASKKNHKFTPISLACYLVSKEAATYRKYISDIRFQNIPEWLILLEQKFQSLVALIQTHSPTKIENSTALTVSAEFSTTEPEVFVKWNTKQALIHYSSFNIIHKFLINSRFLIQDDWNIHLGLNKVCVISSNSIATVDNRTIPLDDIRLNNNKNVLATADCSHHPKFAVVLDDPSDFTKMSFTVYAGVDQLFIQPFENNTTIKLNNNTFDNMIHTKNIKVLRLLDDVVFIRTMFNQIGIDIYYTREYMVIIIPGFYTGKICGVCSSLK